MLTVFRPVRFLPHRDQSREPMSAIRINGIRVGHQMSVLRQYPDHWDANAETPLFRTLAGAGVNMPCLGLEQQLLGSTLSCCVEGDLSFGSGLAPPEAGSMVSVYPHGSKTATLGCLLSLFGRQSIPFLHMVSSNAMISFVVAEENRARALAALESTFDLPPTHTPYEPKFAEETAAFVKKRYQETRAYFQEKRIKTYGFSLETGLTLTALTARVTQIDRLGLAFTGLDSKFYFTAAFMTGGDCHAYCLCSGTPAADGDLAGKGHGDAVDLITFHGPHFGDRFGIFNQAAACLALADIPLILAGCTGASVSLVVPGGLGASTLPALEKGFETP